MTDGSIDERDAAMSELLGIRSSIDNIDAALVHLLAERFKFTQQVGRLKAEHGMPPSDPERERTQIARLRALAEDAHLDPAFAEKWFNFVVAEVIQHHERIAGNGEPRRTGAVSWYPLAPAVAVGPTLPRDRRQRGTRILHAARLAAPARTSCSRAEPRAGGCRDGGDPRACVPRHPSRRSCIDQSSLDAVDAGADRLLAGARSTASSPTRAWCTPPTTRLESIDGNELVLATNVLGHFALFERMLPHLADGARIVSLGSLSTRLSTFRVDDLQLERGYDSWRAYAQSKIASQVIGFELDRRLRAAGAPVASVVAHPGYSITGRTPTVPGVNEPSAGTRFSDALQAAVGAGQAPRRRGPAVRAHRSRRRGRGLLGPEVPRARASRPASGPRACRSIRRSASACGPSPSRRPAARSRCGG